MDGRTDVRTYGQSEREKYIVVVNVHVLNGVKNAQPKPFFNIRYFSKLYFTNTLSFGLLQGDPCG